MSIGRKYNKSSAQVALRFNAQRGVVVIPKSFNLERIKHNFQVQCSFGPMWGIFGNHIYAVYFKFPYNVSDFLRQIFDFSLTEEEMKAIEALNKNIRFVELLMYEYKAFTLDTNLNSFVPMLIFVYLFSCF